MQNMLDKINSKLIITEEKIHLLQKVVMKHRDNKDFLKWKTSVSCGTTSNGLTWIFGVFEERRGRKNIWGNDG